MRRLLIVLCIGPLLAACAGGDDAGPCESEKALTGWCEGPVRQRWDPPAQQDLTLPDDYYTVDDASTPTGLRIDVDPFTHPALSELLPDGFKPVYTGLNDLDGFGTLAGITLRLTGAVDPARIPTGEATAQSDSPIIVATLPSGAPPVRIPVEVALVDDNTTLILEPMVPLPPATRVVAALRSDLPLQGGGCLAPSQALMRLLAGHDCHPDYARITPRLREAADRLVDAEMLDAVTEVGAMVAFTTQSIVEGSVAVAEDLRRRGAPAIGAPTCQEEEQWIACELPVTLVDYRDADGIIRLSDPAQADGSYELTMLAWLPKEAGPFGAAPYPTLFFGHGLGSGASQGRRLASFAAPRGVATIGIPALQHPGHPSAGGSEEKAIVALSFFGLNINEFSFTPAVMRDNWRQSTYDKLQIVELLNREGGVDLDGDGTPDLDPARTGYLGASLGGIMGPELLALETRLNPGIVVVPGARVSDIIIDSELFGGLIDFLRPRGSSDGDIARFFPIIQTVIERGDSGNYAPHVICDRIEAIGGEPVDLLMGMAIDDEVVPNTTNRALARALGVPHIPPVLQDVGVIPVGDAAPVSGNTTCGATAGLFQFDLVEDGDGGYEAAEHDSLPASDIGVHLWLHFLESHLSDGRARIIDPYLELGVK